MAETDGESLDDAYLVRLEGDATDGRVERQQTVASNGSVDFAGLAQGNYEVSMEDLASNCQFREGTSSRQTRTLTPRSSEVVTFGVSCTARAVGSISEHDGGGQSAQVAQELPNPVRVRVLDDEGQPYEGVLVDWSASGEGEATPPSSTTGSDGIASARWRLDTRASAQTLTATVAGQSASVTIGATGEAGPMSQLEVEGGDGQSAPVNTLLPQSLRVRALDQYDNPVPGVGVDWDPANGSGTVSPTSGTTGAQGTTTTRWKLGSTVGTQTVTASAGSEEVTFSADATASSSSDVQAPNVGNLQPPGNWVIWCCKLLFDASDPPLSNGQPGTGVDTTGCPLVDNFGDVCSKIYAEIVGGPQTGNRLNVEHVTLSGYRVDLLGLSDGAYQVRAYVPDLATPSNVGTATFNFTLDNTPPTIMTNTLPPANSGATNSLDVTVNGTVTDAHAIWSVLVEILVDGIDATGAGADGTCDPFDDYHLAYIAADDYTGLSATSYNYDGTVTIQRPNTNGSVIYCVYWEVTDEALEADGGWLGNIRTKVYPFQINWN